MIQHSDSDMLWCNQKVHCIVCVCEGVTQSVVYLVLKYSGSLPYMVTTETDPRLSSLHGNN